MKIKRLAFRSLGAVLWLLLGLVLMATALLLVLYSSWGQNYLREKLVDSLNSKEGIHAEIKNLRLKFPLNLEVDSVVIAVEGDTVVRVNTLNAKVAMLPLLAGNIDVRGALLTDGYYRLGHPDSTMCLKINAGRIALHPTTIKLSNLDINISDGEISNGVVDMALRPDTTATPTDTTQSSVMKIRLRHLSVDNLTYRMNMLPTIDSLGTNIAHGALSDGIIDLGAQRVNLRMFAADSLSAAYIAPATTASTATTPQPVDTTESKPWTITIDTISLSNSRALYATRGVVPQQGLDFAYIQADDIDLKIHGFYNQASILRLPLTMHATERCGITLDASGEFMLNENSMVLKGFDINTDATHLAVDAMMGMGDITSDPQLPLRLNAKGNAAFADLRTMFPGYGPYLALLPRGGYANLAVDISGTPSRLNIADILLTIPQCMHVDAKGLINNVFDPNRIAGDIDIKGNITNVKSIVDYFVDPSMGLSVPPMTLAGNVKYQPGITKGDITAKTLGGDVALKAMYNSKTEGYDIDLESDKFPLNAFMPDMGVGKATLSLKASGQGFDLYSDATHIDVDAKVHSLEYNGYAYGGIDFTALIANGRADVHGSVDTNDLNAIINAKGNLEGDTYNWSGNIDGQRIDLYALKLTTDTTTVTVNADIDVAITPKRNEIAASMALADLSLVTTGREIAISNVNAQFHSADSLTTLSLHNRDLVASAFMPYHYTKIADNFTKAVDLALSQVKERKIDVDTLQRVLPQFDIDVACGADNMLTSLLAADDMSLKHLTLCARNDSVLALDSDILGFTTGATQLDTIAVRVTQLDEKMHMVGTINNRPGNMDNWAHIKIDAMLNTDRVALRLIQQNNAMETGFDLGAIAALADSTVTARIFPLTPMIGYHKWTVNLDNYLKYNFYTHDINANLKMKGDKSAISLLTEHTDSVGRNLNDIILRISDIHIADWISFNPFAPPVSGNLSADMRVKWDGGNDINGKGNVSLTDFYYDKKRVASLDLAMDVETNLQGRIRATADMMVDGERTMRLAGNLNDSVSGSPFNLDFTVVKFPLSTVNPFLPVNVAQLAGTLNGNMLVSGDMANPKLDGELYFSDAAVKAAITNTSYKLSDSKLDVTDNVVKFTDFAISGANENPLRINGTVDIHALSSPKVDLKLDARNMMLVNTQKAARNASVFGKAYIDLDATVRGNMRFMAVNADLTLLAGSNVTYILTFDDNSLTSMANEDIVKFVNFSDTTAVAAADSISDTSMLLNLEAQVNIQNGTTIVVDLPTGQRDKVQIQPQGNLTYSLTPMNVDGRLTGRINLNSGYVRYTLPVVGSEKMFNVDAGSYVAFNGDMLNPVLNLHAVDQVKTNVTQEGQNSRMVNFNIMLGVTGTLDRMDVKFDLATNDDITVANELQSMSPEQRASQAMNMLLYNMYTGPGSSSNINISANPLFSFLESQINNWAAQNIKGVDLSFGIDQYNQTTNGTRSSAMTYSYQVSKTLFNDRFKIVVGGNYSTDSNADENIAENLINDISFEYYLNTQQTMLLKLFRHLGFESILEGQITQTGVGFVYKRKIDSMSMMLPRFMRPKPKTTIKTDSVK